MKTTFKALLFVAVIVLGYLCTMSIIRPIQFEAAKTQREKAVIKKLIDIRKVQVAYLNSRGDYATNFDSLVSFLKNERLPIIIKEGTLTDEQLEQGMTEAEAHKKGIIRRDTNWVNAKDTLLGKSYNADSIRFVPGTDVAFEMSTNSIPTQSGLWVPVFECRTPYEVYLKGLSRQEIVNLTKTAEDLGKYAGLKVGSTNEVNNNAGNWE